MTASNGRVEQYHTTAITKGLKAALSESSIDESLSSVEDGHIKLNKLMYVAAEEFDLLDDLQHSWHIFGSDLGDLVPPTHSVKPRALDELPSTESPNSAEIADESLPTEEDYYEFFKSVEIGKFTSLEEILRANRVELLTEFYEEYPHEMKDFADLYMYNLKLQGLLERHENNIDVNNIGDREYEALATFLSEFRKEFYRHREFSPDSLQQFELQLENNPERVFEEFLELIDDVYFSISRRNTEEIRGDASYIIGELNNLYLKEVWKLVTEVISLYTLRGPRQDPLEEGAKTEIKDVDSRYVHKFENLISECESANLLPLPEVDQQDDERDSQEDIDRAVDDALNFEFASIEEIQEAFCK